MSEIIRPTIIPPDFQSLLTEQQKNSPRYKELMARSDLAPEQQRLAIWQLTEIVGTEEEIIGGDPNSTSQQKEASKKRYFETRNKLLEYLG